MAELTDDDLVWLRTQLGTGQPDATDSKLAEAYDRLLDREAVAVEILTTRLANFEADPATFSIAGVYSQSVKDNIEGIRARLSALGADASGGATVVRIVRPRCRPRR
jgi:hypothetical protein